MVPSRTRAIFALVLSLIWFATTGRALREDTSPNIRFNILSEAATKEANVSVHQEQHDAAARTKRYYSVPKLLPNSDRSAPYAYPWPVDHCGHQWIRYCFVDVSSLNNLHDVLLHAIAKWAPATMVSNLKIVVWSSFPTSTSSFP